MPTPSTNPTDLFNDVETATVATLAADTWLKVIIARVPPKYADLNRQAFHAGREVVV